MEPLGKKLNSIDAVVKIYLISLMVLLFLAYPLALFIPAGFGQNVFNFFLPVFLLASGFSASLLLMLRKGQGKFGLVEISCAVLFLSLLLSSLMNGAPGAGFLKICGIVLIPLAVALSFKTLPEFSDKVCKVGFFLLWLVNVVHCYHKFGSISDLGIAGNRNWLSALLLSTSFVSAQFIFELSAKWMRSTKARWALSIFIIGALTVPILLKADSRASYAAMVLLPFYAVYLLGNRKVRIVLGAVLLAGVLFVPFLFRDVLDRENKRNVRLPMWSSTLKMAVENPLGLGPEGFEKAFPAYVSKAQKGMLVSAETTEHPHNEFLHISISGGIMAGAAWLLLVGIALFSRVADKRALLFRLPLFVLVVQGMLDKPLHQMPTMLLFYLCLGAVLAKSELVAFTLKKPERNKLKHYKAVAALLLGVFGYFASLITVSSWYERQGIRAEQRGEKAESLTYFEKSFNTAPWRLFPVYKAFILSTVDLPDPIKAIDFYEVLESQAPDYRQFNLLKGRFFTLLAHQDRSNAKEHVEAAWKSYNRACELNWTNVHSFIDRIKFAGRFLPRNEFLKAYEELLKLYEYKSESGAEELQISLDEWGRTWHKSKKLSEFLSSTLNLMKLLKVPALQSDYFPVEFRTLSRALSGSYNLGDMVYMTDSILLNNELGQDSFEKAVDKILSEVKITKGAGFTLPRETLRNKTGSSLARLSLLSMAAKSFSYDSMIDLKSSSLFLFKANEFALINENGFQKLNLEKSRELLRNTELHYFDYPQAFFYKNEFLTYALAKAGAAPQFCRNPDYVINNFLKLFSEAGVSVKILREPFLDILRRAKEAGR